MLGVLLAIAVLYLAREIFIPLALAFLFGFLLSPLVKFLERWGIRRSLAVALVVVSDWEHVPADDGVHDGKYPRPVVISSLFLLAVGKEPRDRAFALEPRFGQVRLHQSVDLSRKRFVAAARAQEESNNASDKPSPT